jgi:hypothetical protein
MTDWTAPQTWGPGPTVPSEAELDALRAQLLHLHETLDGFGYPYSPLDPRLIGAAVNAHSFPKYQRCYGRGTIASIRARVTGSAGDIAWGVYGTNAETDWPGARKATTGLVSCPAIGIATVNLIASATVDPGDWFAYAGTDISARTAGPVTNGMVGLMTMHLNCRDLAETISDLPENADPNLTQIGTFAGPTMIGIPA